MARKCADRSTGQEIIWDRFNTTAEELSASRDAEMLHQSINTERDPILLRLAVAGDSTMHRRSLRFARIRAPKRHFQGPNKRMKVPYFTKAKQRMVMIIPKNETLREGWPNYSQLGVDNSARLFVLHWKAGNLKSLFAVILDYYSPLWQYLPWRASTMQQGRFWTVQLST